MNRELVSICIPTYNGAAFLDRCIRSCIAQTYTNIEILINDDCSSDDTFALAQKWQQQDPRIHMFRNPSNLGLVGNWNETLSRVSGTWIKLLFQDDWMEPDCIDEMLKVAEVYPASLIVSKRSYAFEQGVSQATIGYYTDEVKRLPSSSALSFFSPEQIAQLFVSAIGLNFIGEPSLSFFSTSFYRRLGKFDPEFLQVCDLEHMLRAASASGIVYLDKVITHFAVHERSTTSANISVNNFRIRYFEIPALIRKIKNDPAFRKLYSAIGFKGRIKLYLYTKLRAIEAKKAAGATVSLKEKYRELLHRYPFMKITALESVFLFPLFVIARRRS